jgi:hypothetical protein
MQQSTEPGIQIVVRGAGLIQLHCQGRCVGFAVSYRAATFQAEKLGTLFSAQNQMRDGTSIDQTIKAQFGSRKVEMSNGDVMGVTAGAWVVEAGDGTAVREFPVKEDAERFRVELETYHYAMPASAEDGEWSEAQIAWYRNHPAPMASACGGSFRVRQLGVH